MGSSLQEQLLKAGLVNKSKAQQAKKQVRKKKRSKKPGQRDTVADAVAKAQEDKAARDRELNRQREIKQESKARKVLLKQFMEKSMLNNPSAEEAYNFVHGKNVKRLYVTAKQRDQLGEAKLAIAFVAERYYLVSADVVPKIKDMSPDAFIFLPEAEKKDGDDPYADFEVPDDLMW